MPAAEPEIRMTAMKQKTTLCLAYCSGRRFLQATFVACSLWAYLPGANAEDEAPHFEADAKSSEEIVSYRAEFFERYKPNSALEMVRRIPGFQLDDGDDKRGFGAAAGNILINDRYPSAKQDKASSILERIPPTQVQRIDLIRGQVRGIDLRGKTAVASIILRQDIPATTRWDVAIRKNFEHSPVTVRTSISLSDSWRALEYNVGLVYRRFRSGELGDEDIVDAAGNLLEARFEDLFLRGDEGNVNLNVATWLGETLINMNTQVGFEERNETTDSLASARDPAGVGDDFFVDQSDERLLEFGADAERSLNPDLLAKGILLYTRSEKDVVSTQDRFDSAGMQSLFRIADSEVVESEAIARVELDWAGWKNHALKFDLEGARNVIDGELVQTVDDGTGPVIVPVPGANTRVQEDRVELLINDTWFRGVFELDYGLGAESSTIEQTGDARQKRSFFFLKPRFSVAYSPSKRRQTRFRIAREVSQLDFSDFVSSTVFQDDDLSLGNPNLRPESTWVAELSEERRFGELSVFKATLFYNWISDVEDLLPLTPMFEAPGNIGSGKRWGVEFEATLPFDRFGLDGARLDIEARLQDSDVTDPVTGNQRELSGEGDVTKPLPFRNENRYAFGIDFRQDLEAKRVAWGWDVRRRGNRTAYRVNELVEYEDGLEVNVFMETTRWLGLKIRIEGQNLTNFDQFRYRTIYTGERDLSPVDVVEVRDRIDGRRVLLTISGSF